MIARNYIGKAKFTNKAKRELRRSISARIFLDNIVSCNGTPKSVPGNGIQIEYNGRVDWFDRTWLEPLTLDQYIKQIEL